MFVRRAIHDVGCTCERCCTCEPTPEAFAQAYAQVAALAATPQLREMGHAARAHVEAQFSLEAFGRKLERYLRQAGALGDGEARDGKQE